MAADQAVDPAAPAGGQRSYRPRVDDRAVLEGIPYVLTTGITWRSLPPALGRPRRRPGKLHADSRPPLFA